MNLETDCIHVTRINLKLMIDLTVKCKTIKFIEDNIGENLDNHRYCKDFGYNINGTIHEING